MATETTTKFPKNTNPARTASWRKSPEYAKGVAKSEARRFSRLQKALRNPATTEQERIKATDWIADYQNRQSQSQKSSALGKDSA